MADPVNHEGLNFIGYEFDELLCCPRGRITHWVREFAGGKVNARINGLLRRDIAQHAGDSAIDARQINVHPEGRRTGRPP